MVALNFNWTPFYLVLSQLFDVDLCLDLPTKDEVITYYRSSLDEPVDSSDFQFDIDGFWNQHLQSQQLKAFKSLNLPK
jgi:hypothetical protein